MVHPATWNPFSEWKHTDIDWVKVKISPEDLKRFTQRSNLMGLVHGLGFLAILTATGGLAYWAFIQEQWILMAIAIYLHGSFYAHFGNALHELIHKTVFASHWLNTLFTTVYGLLYWAENPYLYRLSHQNFHHRYTLHQGSDGEDTPNYVDLSLKALLPLLSPFQAKSFILCTSRLLTLKPTSKGWRGRGYRLDNWEQFVLNKASDKDRRQVYRFAAYALVFQAAFVATCLYFEQWFPVILVTLAPFYGFLFYLYYCGIHQHAACEANHPDFRVSCRDAILDPLSSFLYWRMEYHIEHHMFASIPCYNLKKFSQFAADQLPPKGYAIPQLVKLCKLSREKYGSVQNWRDCFGRYKGI